LPNRDLLRAWMEQMRNRLLHRYWDVTPSEMFAFLPARLADFQRFAEPIVSGYSL